LPLAPWKRSSSYTWRLPPAAEDRGRNFKRLPRCAGRWTNSQKCQSNHNLCFPWVKTILTVMVPTQEEEMSTFAEKKAKPEEIPEKEPPEDKHRVVDYSFTADCTLYLDNETLVRKTIEGKWFSARLLNEAEWYANAEHTLAWLVGVLHHHDPTISAKVVKHVVHKWTGWY
jgi:hypothetical protein